MDGLTIEQAALGDLEEELADTRAVLQRIPDDAWGWRPGAGGWTMGELANHTTQLVFWTLTTLDRDEFDAATAGDEGRVVADRRDSLLERFDELAGKVRDAAQAVDAAALGAPWTLRAGPQVVFTMPRAVALRRMCINHLVHHRAQVAYMLRLRGVEPPSLYGA